MGAVADLATYLAARDAQARLYNTYKESQSASAADYWYSFWTRGPTTGSTPSTAAALTGESAGSLLQLTNWKNPSANARWLSWVEHAGTVVDSNIGVSPTMLIDRLSHQGGLSAIVTTAQTTNLPTAALTRYTSGVGVMAALEVYTAIGTTATTATVSYTNQNGTSGRTSQAIAFGGASPATLQGNFLPIPLADGDTGVRSVESVTVLATTGTAGNFGVTLFKPLAFLGHMLSRHPYKQGRMSHCRDFFLQGGAAVDVGAACLALITRTADTTGTTGSLINLGFVEA